MSSKVVLSVVKCDAEKLQMLTQLISENFGFEVEIINETIESVEPVEPDEPVFIPQVSEGPVDMKLVSEILISAGIPVGIKGFRFLCEAIRLVIEQPDLMFYVTKGLYPAVAKCFDTSASKVERAIRHAIEVGWSREKMQKAINKMFGKEICAKHDKPTNCEFIALIKEKLFIDDITK